MIRRSAAIALFALACAHAHPRSDEAHPDEVDADGVGDQRVSARAYHHYLDALLAKNADDFATAADELREALLYDAESPHLHTVLAEVLVKQGRIADAEDELKTALALDSKYGPAHVLSGRIAVSRGQTMQARDHFQAAVEGQPDDPDAYRELARLLLSIGDVPAAQRVAERLGDRLQAAQKLSSDDADELHCGSGFSICDGRQPWPSVTDALFIAKRVYCTTRLIQGALEPALRRLALLHGGLRGR